MLLQFKIRNFRSIRDEVVIDFTPSSKIKKSDLPNNIITKGKYSAVSSLILYGRNASGKSNILKALKILNEIIRTSDKNKLDDKLPYTPFIFDIDYQNAPTEFRITFVAENNIKYEYFLKYKHNTILKESLSFYPEGKIVKLFDRDEKKFSRGKSLKGNTKDLTNEMLDNQLFLSLSARKKIKHLTEAYLFISRDMFVDLFETSDIENFATNFFSHLVSKGKYKRNIQLLLSAADTNISDFNINLGDNQLDIFDVDKEDIVKEENIKLILKTTIQTSHNIFKNGKEMGRQQSLDFKEESLGTQKFYLVATLVYMILRTQGTLVIDELDKSLHPLLTRMLIGLFHSKKNNPHGAQLIFATHDATLLDNELFRRDQIMFVEKGYEGLTEVYKMSDMTGVRDNIPYDKWYLSGRFKAVPIIGEVELEF